MKSKSAPPEWLGGCLAAFGVPEESQRLQVATDSRSDRAEPRNEFVENCRQ
jgi:hypothetical protein